MGQALATDGISENAPRTIRTNEAGLEGGDCLLRELAFIILRKVTRGVEEVYSSGEARTLPGRAIFGAMRGHDAAPLRAAAKVLVGWN